MDELGPTRSPAKKNANFFRSIKHRIYQFLTRRTRVLTAPSDQPNSSPHANMDERVQQADLPNDFHLPFEESPPGYTDELVQQADVPNNLHLSFEESSPANMDELVQQVVRENNHYLPFEIMQEIFHLATHQDDLSVDNTDRSFRHHKDLPWGISQVCREWRYIALSTPFLWATLPAINLNRNHASQKVYVDIFADIMRRSGNALINIHVVDEEFRDSSHPVVDLLVQHSKRWQKITLDMPLYCLCAFQGAKGNLPALRTLIADWYNTDSWIDKHLPNGASDLFLNAPQLRNVNITKGRRGVLLLPYTGLLKYKQCFGLVNELNLISCCSPGLISLELKSINFTPHTPHPTVYFPHLVLFKIHLVHPYLLRWLLRTIAAPALEELQIHAFANETDEITPAITSLLSRSSPPLERLDIREVYSNPGQLTDLLLLTPLLTHLHVPMPPLSDIAALTSTGIYGSMFAPNLRDCIFTTLRDTSSEQMRHAVLLANARGPELRMWVKSEVFCSRILGEA